MNQNYAYVQNIFLLCFVLGESFILLLCNYVMYYMDLFKLVIFLGGFSLILSTLYLQLIKGDDAIFGLTFACW